MGQILQPKTSSVDIIYDNYKTDNILCIFTSDIKSRDGTSLEKNTY